VHKTITQSNRTPVTISEHDNADEAARGKHADHVHRRSGESDGNGSGEGKLPVKHHMWRGEKAGVANAKIASIGAEIPFRYSRGVEHELE
jgi:hypothetical protein